MTQLVSHKGSYSDPSNILTTDSFIAGCLIIRLDDSPYAVEVQITSDEPFSFDAKGSIIYGMIPSLTEWIRLWWSLRKRRREQKQPAAAVLIKAPDQAKKDIA